jgi:hypothetical protein
MLKLYIKYFFFLFFVFNWIGKEYAYSLSTRLPRGAQRILETKIDPGFDSLKETIDSNKLGFMTYLSDEDQENALTQAREYIQWRQKKLSKSKRQEIEDGCKKNKNFHIFCPIMLDSDYYKYIPTRRTRVNMSRRRAQSQKALQAIRKNQVDSLDSFEESEIRLALRQFKSFKSLNTFITALNKDFNCKRNMASFLIAGKLEEFFPDKEARNTALDFYQKSAECGVSEVYSRSLFRAGLLLVWEKKYKEALQVFEDLSFKAKDREYLSRGLYWMSQVAEHLKQEDKVKIARKRLLEEAALSIHALLAHGEFPEEFQNFYFTPDSAVLFKTTKKEHLNRDILMAELMISIDEISTARRMLQARFEQFEDTEPEFRLYLAYLFNRADFYIEKFRLIAPLYSDNPSIISRASLEIFFPYKKFNEKHFVGSQVNEYLALALIRQESAFNPRAHSAMNARGLMQVLPTTARTVDRKVTPAQLFNEDINVRIGTKYFDRLIRRFDGDVESALMGYNAGALRVGEWNKRYPVDHSVLFLDLVPFKETREYVASIARNYFWYATLYKGKEIEKPEDFKMPEGIRSKFKILDLKQKLPE